MTIPIFTGGDNIVREYLKSNSKTALYVHQSGMQFWLNVVRVLVFPISPVWSCSSSTYQQERECCHCWAAAGSVASVVMVGAAGAGSWWWMGTGRDTPQEWSASFGLVEDCCGAEHGWRSSSQLWAEGALSTERANAWRSSVAIRWTLAAVIVSGAGVVPPWLPRVAWWCFLASPRSSQRPDSWSL